MTQYDIRYKVMTAVNGTAKLFKRMPCALYQVILQITLDLYQVIRLSVEGN